MDSALYDEHIVLVTGQDHSGSLVRRADGAGLMAEQQRLDGAHASVGKRAAHGLVRLVCLVTV